MRTIHRLVEEKTWNADAIASSRSKPRRPNPSDDSAEPKAQDAQSDIEERSVQRVQEVERQCREETRLAEKKLQAAQV